MITFTARKACMRLCMFDDEKRTIYVRALRVVNDGISHQTFRRHVGKNQFLSTDMGYLRHQIHFYRHGIPTASNTFLPTWNTYGSKYISANMGYLRQQIHFYRDTYGVKYISIGIPTASNIYCATDRGYLRILMPFSILMWYQKSILNSSQNAQSPSGSPSSYSLENR
jgi:hypothetical protein